MVDQGHQSLQTVDIVRKNIFFHFQDYLVSKFDIGAEKQTHPVVTQLEYYGIRVYLTDMLQGQKSGIFDPVVSAYQKNFFHLRGHRDVLYIYIIEFKLIRSVQKG